MNDEIKVKNLKLEIEQLEQERKIAAEKLSVFYKELEQDKWGERGVKELLDLVEKAKKRMWEWEIKQQQSQEIINRLKKQQKREILRHLSYVRDLEDEKKQYIKKLEGLNFRIMNAEKQYNELNEKNKQLENEVQKMNETLKDKDELTESLEALREEYNKLLYRYSILAGEYNNKMVNLKKQVNEANQQTGRLQEEANQAEYKIKSFNNEYIRKMKDMSIYIKRTEAKFKKAFPGLEMKLK